MKERSADKEIENLDELLNLLNNNISGGDQHAA
jgi:hypothetical protein